MEQLSSALGYANVSVTADTYRHVSYKEIIERYQRFGPIRSNSHDCIIGNASCVKTFVIQNAHDDVQRFTGTVTRSDASNYNQTHVIACRWNNLTYQQW
jgi:hypothetical protein